MGGRVLLRGTPDLLTPAAVVFIEMLVFIAVAPPVVAHRHARYLAGPWFQKQWPSAPR